MSMPQFPEEVLDITCDQAFNMLLGSIAMEELALSHIMNAEGEKLQYILGTLPRKPCPCSTPKEVLQVNRSVSDLLEKVAYNQLLLKGKLQQVLEARDAHCPPPVCPPDPVPPSPCLSGWTAEKKRIWPCGCPLSWKQTYARGACIAWQKCSPSLVYLAPQQSYFSSVTFNVRVCAPGPVRITLRASQNGVFLPIATYESCGGAPDTVVQLSGGTTLILEEHGSILSPFQIVLDTPQSVFLERAEWNITLL